MLGAASRTCVDDGVAADGTGQLILLSMSACVILIKSREHSMPHVF